MIHIETVPRNCPICQTDLKSTLFAECNLETAQFNDFSFASRKLPEYMHWRLLVCGDCDLLYASPAPTDSTLAKLYNDADYASKSEANSSINQTRRSCFSEEVTLWTSSYCIAGRQSGDDRH